MTDAKPTLNRETLLRVLRMIRGIVADPDVGRKAMLYSAGLIVFLLTVNGLNVVNSYVGRFFMTAIEEHDRGGFWRYALLSIAVFGLLTLGAVLLRYLEESLGLLWRKWLTWHLFRRYADHRVYYRLQKDADQVENPDLRRELGEKGRKYVEKYHDHRKIAGEFIRLLTTGEADITFDPRQHAADSRGKGSTPDPPQ